MGLVHLDVLSLDLRKPPRALAAARLVSGSLGEVLLEGLDGANWSSIRLLYQVLFKGGGADLLKPLSPFALWLSSFMLSSNSYHGIVRHREKYYKYMFLCNCFS